MFSESSVSEEAEGFARKGESAHRSGPRQKGVFFHPPGAGKKKRGCGSVGEERQTRMSSSSTKSEEAGQEWELHRLASLKAQPGSHHHFSNAEVCFLLFLSARDVCVRRQSLLFPCLWFSFVLCSVVSRPEAVARMPRRRWWRVASAPRRLLSLPRLQLCFRGDGVHRPQLHSKLERNMFRIMSFTHHVIFVDSQPPASAPPPRQNAELFFSREGRRCGRFTRRACFACVRWGWL